MPIKITVRKNGPLFIHPDEVDQVTLVDHEGNVIERPGKSITLCRCGASATKPFCDGTHSKIGFQAGERAREEFDAQQARVREELGAQQAREREASDARPQERDGQR